MTRAAYIDAILSIKDYILDGDTYQVNYTLKYLFEAGGNPFELYQALRVRQRTEFAAFINAPDRRVLFAVAGTLLSASRARRSPAGR